MKITGGGLRAKNRSMASMATVCPRVEAANPSSSEYRCPHTSYAESGKSRQHLGARSTFVTLEQHKITGAISRGSEWHRWDPHIHTPGTLLNDQFGSTEPWD